MYIYIELYLHTPKSSSDNQVSTSNSFHLDEVRHSKIHVAALPGQLQGNIGAWVVRELWEGIQAICEMVNIQRR